MGVQEPTISGEKQHDFEPAQPVEAQPAAEQQVASSGCPLPGEDDVWKGSTLGSWDGWSPTLQAYSKTISSFPYPAAIYWGDKLILLHNEEWLKHGGVAEQGQSQGGSLSPDAWRCLSAAIKGGRPAKGNGHSLLRDKNNSTEYTTFVSPLFSDAPKSENVTGVLVQLLPKDDGDAEKETNKGDGGASGKGEVAEKNQHRNSLLSGLGELPDNVPLDQHPFFHRFAEMLPSGLAILDQRAQAVFVNQHFYQLTTHQGDDLSFKSWPQSIHPDDYDRVMDAYRSAFENQTQLRTEFRALGHEHPWRLLLLTPLGDENLQHVSLREYGGFICSVVDISSQKSMELAERKAARDAVERKEQQERFIDMVSHEIRNPLSAILHCTEDIEEATRAAENDHGRVDLAVIKDCLETIGMCILHQRNIVDDVLSFSKLDASMLSLRPKPSQPGRQLAISLKMFQPEFRKQNIAFEYCIDKMYEEERVDWVLADLARIGQVVVNLITNAIKFTKGVEGREKKITVAVAASKTRPNSYPPDVVFFDADNSAYRMDATNTKDWGSGDVLYIMVAVIDTGIGISETGQRKLFERFRQATPKTEEIYGGSGLGLNISRKICHLHGGEIGVASKENRGSTFGFFFKVKPSAGEDGGDSKQDGESQTTPDQEVKDHVSSTGLDPDEHEDGKVPQSLTDLPVSSSEDVENKMLGHGDGRYEQSLKVATEVQDAEDALQARKVTTLASRSKEGRENKTHVLLVEDNLVNQKILVRKLQAKDFAVTIANNGREAVDAIRTAPRSSSGDAGAFDVVLMDQEMPVMNGNAATEEIRRLEREGQVEKLPIIGVTANVRGEQQDQMIESGMDEVIGKPYKIEEMIQKVNKVLGEK